MENESSNFSSENTEEVSIEEFINNEESPVEEEVINNDFPIEMMEEIVKDVVKDRNIPGINNEIVKEFNTLLKEKRFINEKVKFTDKKIVEVVKNMIRRTSIPGPGDELYNDLYKVLVKNLSNDLKQSNTNDLDTEVTARKLAAWVLSFDEELKNMAQKNEEEGEQPLPQNPYYYRPHTDGSSRNKQERNVKLYNLSEQHSGPYWQAPGEVVELKDKEGSQVYVKGLEEGEGKKTLVKKIKSTNKGKEISSWIVEVPNKEQIKSVEENIKLSRVVEKTQNMKLRTPVTVDEWKTVADIRREEAESWRNLLGYDSDEAVETSGDTSKSTDHPQTELKNKKTGQEKSDDARGTNPTSKKYVMDAADLKRSLKGFQKVNLNLNPEQENYLINELKKKSGRTNVKDEDWKRFLSSTGNHKIQLH